MIEDGTEDKPRGRLLLMVYQAGTIHRSYLPQFGQEVKKYGIDLLVIAVANYPMRLAFFNVDNLPEADVEKVRELMRKEGILDA